MTVPTTAAMGAWTMLPFGFLRQAGFPLDRLDPLRAPELASAVTELDVAASDLGTATDVLARMLAPHRHSPWYQHAATRIGQGRRLRTRVADVLRSDPQVGNALAAWEKSLAEVEAADHRYRAGFADHMAANRRAVVAAFADEALRDMLLLSNDASYQFFAQRLDTGMRTPDRMSRAFVDTLARYLQRVSTKNETHSHFGPFTPVRTSQNSGWLWHVAGRPERTAHLSYWAAQRIADVIAGRREVRSATRPRLHPMAFVEPGRATRYGIIPMPSWGMDHWRFGPVEDRVLSDEDYRLLTACDGSRSRASLQAGFDRPDFDEWVDEFIASDWLFSGFEIPSGTTSALADLRSLVGTVPADAEVHDLLEHIAEQLRRLENAPLGHRAAPVETLKELFSRFTGTSPNRGHGHIYADRTVLFEECRSELRSMTIGPEISNFITDDLAVAYELMLIRPRFRMRHESAILDAWCRRTYRPGEDVPILRFYEDYFADIDTVRAECVNVTRALDEATARMESVLLGPDPAARRVEVSPTALQTLLADYADRVPAVLNPDVMFFADDESAFRTGRFSAVIGDCHAVRDLLTHTSVAGLLATELPDFAETVAAHYQGLVEPDETLVDIVRRHVAKTDAQHRLPLPDLELFGRSGKAAGEVLRLNDLYLRVGAGRLELRARTRPERLRLLACPAGSPSILGDPLAAFAFPRQFGGAILDLGDRTHIPRVSSGRVTLVREQWRIAAGRIASGAAGDDAADFAAVQRLRRSLGLPNPIFAKAPSEPKPIYVDFDSPILVRQLVRLARTGITHVDFSEMLPGPGQLWLRPHGRAFTSELRCVLFSSGPR